MWHKECRYVSDKLSRRGVSAERQAISGRSAVSLGRTSDFVKPFSFNGDQLPADLIRYAIRLCFCVSHGFHDIESRMTQRGGGGEVRDQALRCRTIRFAL